MKYKIVLIVAFILGSLCSVQAQNEVELTGSIGDSIKSICERFLREWTPPGKVLPTVHIVRTDESTECYFDLIINRSELRMNPPSSYFRLSKGDPVAVYYGLERNVRVNETQLNVLLGLSGAYLEPDDMIWDIHYYSWHCKFKGDQLVELKEKLTSKQYEQLRKWTKRRDKP